MFLHSISILGAHIVSDVGREHTNYHQETQVVCSHIPYISILGAHIVPDVWREPTITKRHKSDDMFSHFISIPETRHMSYDMLSHFISIPETHVV
jgi:hypothetical protein